MAWELIPDVIVAFQTCRVKECIQTQSMFFLFCFELAKGAWRNNFFCPWLTSVPYVCAAVMQCLSSCRSTTTMSLLTCIVDHRHVTVGCHWIHQLLFIPEGSSLNMCLSVWGDLGDGGSTVLCSVLYSLASTKPGLLQFSLLLNRTVILEPSSKVVDGDNGTSPSRPVFCYPCVEVPNTLIRY